MNIGTLDLEVLVKDDKIKGMLEETKRRIQDFSHAMKQGGSDMDGAFDRASKTVERGFETIGSAIEMNKASIAKLQKEYEELGRKAGDALMKGKDDKYVSLISEQSEKKSLISANKKVLNELYQADEALVQYSKHLNEQEEKTKKNAKAQAALSTQYRKLRDEMATMATDGQSDTEEYAKKQEAAVKLGKSISDVNKQTRAMAHDQAAFQGVVSGLTGIAGAASAAQGAMALFAGEDENLQRLMVKIQGLMSVTMGLQQLAQTLSKDSAFQLVTMQGIKGWWDRAKEAALGYGDAIGEIAEPTQSISETVNSVSESVSNAAEAISEAAGAATDAAGAVSEAANTVATKSNTAAKGENAVAETTDAAATRVNTQATNQNTVSQAANTTATAGQAVAAETGTVANLTLAGAFRAVGAAIKSIPVIGWVIAGIAALVAVVSHFASKAAEARKEAEEFYRAVAEEAGKPVAQIQKLAHEWASLGDDMKAKEKFIKDNKETFDRLSLAINSVADAENLLIKNRDAFIQAQIAKAKAAILYKRSEEDVEALMEAERKLEEAQKTPTVERTRVVDNLVFTDTITNPDIAKFDSEVEKIKGRLEDGYKEILAQENEAAKNMEKAGARTAESYGEGTLGALEHAISERRKKLSEMATADPAAIRAAMKEIEKLEKQRDDLLGKDDGKARRDAERKAQQRIDATLEMAKRQRKIENETIRFSQEMQQKQLDIEDDSFQKRMMQNDLNYEKEKQAIKEKEEELLNELKDMERAEWEKNGKTGLFEPIIKSLPEEMKGRIDALYDVAEKAHENGRKKIIKEENDLWSEENTRFDSSLKKQLKEIDVYYDARIKLAKGNEQLIKKQEENREKERLQAITQSYIKEKSVRLDNEQKMAESLLEARKNEYVSESLYELKKIQLLRDYARKRLDVLKTSTAVEGSDEAKRNSEEIDNINQFVLELEEKARAAILRLVSESTSGLMEIADAIGEISEEAGEAVEEIKILGSAIIQIAQGNYIGAAVTALAGIITSNIKQHEKAVIEAKNREDAYFEAVNWKIERQIELMKELNGLTAQNIGDMVQITETMITDKRNDLLEILRGYDWTTKDSYFNLIDAVFGSFSDYTKAGKEVTDLFDKIFFDQTNKQKAGKTTYYDLFEHLAEDEILSLRGIEGIWSILPQDVRDYITALAEAVEQQKELERTVQQMYTGSSLEQITGSLDELYSEADLTFEKIGESFEEHMKRAILNTVSRNSLGKIQDWYEQFAKAMEDGILSPEEAEMLRQKYREIADSGNEAYKNALEMLNMPIEGITSSMPSLAGAIKGASQEEINALAGYMNNTMITEHEQTDLIRDQLMLLSNIDGKIGISNQFLESIDGRLTVKSDPLRAIGIQ